MAHRRKTTPHNGERRTRNTPPNLQCHLLSTQHPGSTGECHAASVVNMALVRYLIEGGAHGRCLSSDSARARLSPARPIPGGPSSKDCHKRSTNIPPFVHLRYRTLSCISYPYSVPLTAILRLPAAPSFAPFLSRCSRMPRGSALPMAPMGLGQRHTNAHGTLYVSKSIAGLK